MEYNELYLKEAITGTVHYKGRNILHAMYEYTYAE